MNFYLILAMLLGVVISDAAQDQQKVDGFAATFIKLPCDTDVDCKDPVKIKCMQATFTLNAAKAITKKVCGGPLNCGEKKEVQGMKYTIVCEWLAPKPTKPDGGGTKPAGGGSQPPKKSTIDPIIKAVLNEMETDPAVQEITIISISDKKSSTTQTFALFNKNTNQKNKADKTLTKKRIELIRSSWAKAMTLGEETVGVILFRNIFKIAPGVLKLFSFAFLVDEGKDIYESAQLKAHATKVVQTVGAAVGLLDDLGTLVPILQDLGKRHVGRGVKPEYYPVIGQALMATFKAGLGNDFTPETEEAWGVAYGIISATMIGDNYK